MGVAVVFGIGLTASLGRPQRHITEHTVRMQSAPDEYRFFDIDKKRVVEYKSECTVTGCVGRSLHPVPLEVTDDEQQTTIESGDCMPVEAKQITLEPETPLEKAYPLFADVDTLDRLTASLTPRRIRRGVVPSAVRRR